MTDPIEPISMGTALEDHYSPARPAVDRTARDLVNAAHGFVPDLQAEAALEARAADPERFDRDYRAMHGDSLALALYDQQRAAAIATGAWKPTTPKEQS